MADQDRNRPNGRPERGSGGRPQGSGRPNSGGRPGGRSGGPRRDDRDAKPARPAWQERVANNPDQAYTKPKAPPIPDEINSGELPLNLRVQLKTLTEENAEQVARHLAMVCLLIDQDPELALEHAKAAGSRAGRISFIRETLGVTAYTAGDFGLALRELLAHRRATGSQDQLPLIVDSERGLGRPKRALEEGRSVDRNSLEPSVRVNLAIAMSGARLDLGENELALAELEIRELDPAKVFEYSVALFWAYSDTLEVLGRETESKRWAELAERAEKALNPEATGDSESISVLEEIEIPLRRDEQESIREQAEAAEERARPVRKAEEREPVSARESEENSSLEVIELDFGDGRPSTRKPFGDKPRGRK
jgi:23S rRNA pseudouridine2605 synthase